jgi:hypothetical protein
MNIDEYKAMVSTQESGKDTPVVEQEQPVTQEFVEDAKPVDVPTKVKIGDEEFDIEELKKGYLRQSDYTKKTQEVANQRREAAQALELFNKFKTNPELADRLQEIDGSDFFDRYNTTELALQEAQSKVHEYELRLELQQLTSKYKDFDEVEVLNEANRRGLTDLEFVYKALKGERGSQMQDADSIREQIKAELLAELQGTTDTTTILKAQGASAPKAAKKIQLSQSELKMASIFGMTPDEYVRNKSSK